MITFTIARLYHKLFTLFSRGNTIAMYSVNHRLERTHRGLKSEPIKKIACYKHSGVYRDSGFWLFNDC